MDQTLSLAELLRRSREWLAARGVENASREVDEMACRAMACRRIDLYLLHDRIPLEQQVQTLRSLLKRRGSGEPLQYLLGSQPFRKAEIRVDSRVLIPRPETEELVELVLSREARHQGLRVLDAGTGSGCVAVSLAQELPGCHVLAVDSSRAALDLAQENARLNGVEERITFSQVNLLISWPDEVVDVLVSNPPYVAEFERGLLAPELAHEPQDALFGGEDGLLFYRRFATGLARLVKPGGRFYLEIGSSQTSAVLDIFGGVGIQVESGRDLSGRDRFIYGLRPENPPPAREEHEFHTHKPPEAHASL